jgi:hypothetical protein
MRCRRIFSHSVSRQTSAFIVCVMPARDTQTFIQKGCLLVRGAAPLIGVALVLLLGPTLLVWRWAGGPFDWRYLVVGGMISLGLLAALALVFAWAVGRVGQGRRR